MLNTLLMVSLLLGSQTKVAKPYINSYRNVTSKALSGNIKKETPAYTEKYIVTAYSTHPSENGGYTITSTGKKLRKGIIAVDPKHIPMGSHIFVPGYGWGIAADIGGAIRGRHIDVCIPSRHMVGRWGRQKIKITIYPKHK